MNTCIASMLDEHIQDNFGEVLPHVFFGDLTRYVVSLFLGVVQSGDGGTQQDLRGILDFLEEAYEGGDPEVQELISVSFLEHIPMADEAGWELRKMLGPSLYEQLRIIG